MTALALDTAPTLAVDADRESIVASAMTDVNNARQILSAFTDKTARADIERLLADAVAKYKHYLEAPPTLGDLIADGEATIVTVEDAYAELGIARREEMALEDERASLKQAIITRIGGAVTAAEKQVSADAEYQAHRAKQSTAVWNVERCTGLAKAAEHRARLSVVLVEQAIAMRIKEAA